MPRRRVLSLLCSGKDIMKMAPLLDASSADSDAAGSVGWLASALVLLLGLAAGGVARRRRGGTQP